MLSPPKIQGLRKRSLQAPPKMLPNLNISLSASLPMQRSQEVTKADWFKKPERPPTPDPDWSKRRQVDFRPPQTWISQVAHAEEPLTSFDEFNDTSFDFSAFVINRLKILNLTQEFLVGLTFNLLKGTCKSITELEYHLEEFSKATTERLDWHNPENKPYPFDLKKPLSLIQAYRGRQIIPKDYFINKDLEYLKGGDLSRKYSTSVTKTKDATYELKWIKDLISEFQNRRDIPLDSVVVLRYEKRSESENKGRVPTEMELVLEQTQQGTSYEVSVSVEGVEELKRKVKIKSKKEKGLLTLRQKPGSVYTDQRGTVVFSMMAAARRGRVRFIAVCSYLTDIHKDIMKAQIDTDDLEEMNLKWQMSMLTMRASRFLNKTGRKISVNGSKTIGFNISKVKCYNCHKRGHFVRECRAPRENRNIEPVRRNVTVETTETKALVAQDGLGSSSSDSESQLNVGAYKAGLESVEARLDVYKKNEIVFEKDIKILKLDVMLRDNALTKLRKKFEKAKKERDDLKLTLEKFENSSKNLSKLLEIQVSDTFKTGVGFDSQVFDSQENDKYKISEGEDENETKSKSKQRKPSFAKVEFVKSNEHVKSPRESIKKVENNKQAKYLKKNSQSPRAVLMKSGLKTLNTARQNSSRAAISVNTARPINTAYPRPTVNYARPASNVFNIAHSHVRRPFNKFTTNKNNNLNEKVNIVRGNVTTVRPKVVVNDKKGNLANVVKASACWVWRPKQKVIDHGNPQLELEEKGVINSECSRHMTGNKSYLSYYEEIDGVFVAFGGSTKGGKINGKGKISTGKLDFEDMYFVKELKFNLFSVSQMCDKKNNVLFTDTECLFLSPDL
ncbi:ribonuclease H-like domain-containing protein [Tanacetum coccineum]